METITCSICLEELKHGGVTLDLCSHRFHLHCLKEWSNFGYECPCCRKPFQENNINDNRFDDYYDDVEFMEENELLLGATTEFIEAHNELPNELIDQSSESNNNEFNYGNYTKDPSSPEFHVVHSIELRDSLMDILKDGDMVKVINNNGTSFIHLWSNNSWSILNDSESNETLIGYLCDTYGENILETLSEKTLEIILDGIAV